MVENRRLNEILGGMKGYLANLRQLQALPTEELTGDPVKLGAAKYYLQIAIESCLDLANYLIAQHNWRRPESMADAFAVLAENGVVDDEFLVVLRRMARFRNRLVHLYWEVDAKVIYELLQDNLGDFDRFEAAILAFLQ